MRQGVACHCRTVQAIGGHESGPLAYTLEHRIDTQSLVLHSQVEVVIEVWSCSAVTYRLAVVGINLVVTSQIHILDITRINRSKVLYRIAQLLHFCGRNHSIAIQVIALLEEAIGYITESLTISLTCRRGIGKELRCLSLLLNDGLVQCHGCTQTDGEILVEFLAVISRNLKALLVDDTYILIRSVQSEDS